MDIFWNCTIWFYGKKINSCYNVILKISSMLKGFQQEQTIMIVYHNLLQWFTVSFISRPTWYSANCCCGVNADGIIGWGLITGCCIGCGGGTGLWTGLWTGWWTSGWTWGAGLGGGCGLARTLGCGLELMGGGLVVLLSVLSCTWATALGATSYK